MKYINRIFIIFLLAAQAGILFGCGGAGVGVVAVLFDDEDDDDLLLSPASLSVTTPAGSPIQDDVSVQFTLSHPASANTSIVAEYYNPANGLWSFATISGAATEGTDGLTTSPAGVTHTFLWDSRTDLGHGIYSGVRARISPLGGLGATTAEFTVDNTEPPVLTITGFTPAVQEYGDIAIDFSVSDFESDNVWVQVRYSLDGGATFPPEQAANRAAGLGNSMYNLETDNTGRPYTFMWDSRSNLGDTFSSDVTLQLIPFDSKGGAPASTASFIVNNTTPAIYASGPASIANDKVPINFNVVDSHSDNVDILVQYSIDGGVSWNGATTIVDPSGYLFAGVTDLPSSPVGVPNVYYWNSFVDLPSTPAAVIFRLRPIEKPTGAPGSWIWTVGFPVNNNYISTVAGTILPGSVSAQYANLKSPAIVRLNPSERAYILDPGQYRVRAVNLTAFPLMILGVLAQPGQIVNVVGTGNKGFPEEGAPATNCSFQELSAIELDPDNSVHAIYIADRLLGQVYYVDESGILSVVAGNGRKGLPEEGAIARLTTFQDISDIAIDASRNIFIASEQLHCIWRIDYTQQTVERFSGSVGVQGFVNGVPRLAAVYRRPARISVDPAGNLYVLDKGNQRVRVINNEPVARWWFGLMVLPDWVGSICGNAWDGLNSGGVPDGTLEDEGSDGGDGGNPMAAYLNNPDGLYVDNMSLIYVADSLNRRFRVMNPTGGAVVVAGTSIASNTIDTFAGSLAAAENTGDDGPATSAGFGYPVSMAVAEDGTVYLVDMLGRRVRTAATDGIIRTFAGGIIDVGEVLPADVARLNAPESIVFGPDGSLYIADTDNHRVVRLDLSTATISVVAGDGTFNPDLPIADLQPATSVMLGSPAGIAFDCVGNLYISERANHIVRVVNLTALPILLSGKTIDPGDIGIIAGNGIDGHLGDGGEALLAELSAPSALVVDNRGLVSIVTGNHIRIVNPTDNDITVGGLFIPSKGIDNLAGQEDNGFADGPLGAASFTAIGGILHDGHDHYFIADCNGLIRALNLDTVPLVLDMSVCGSVIVPPMEVGTYAGIYGGAGGPNGDGRPAINARIYSPAHLMFDNEGDIVFVERGTSTIRHIQMSTGLIWTLSGAGPYAPDEDAVPPEQASFVDPVGVAIDSQGFMYISDATDNKVRRFYIAP